MSVMVTKRERYPSMDVPRASPTIDGLVAVLGSGLSDGRCTYETGSGVLVYQTATGAQYKIEVTRTQ